MIPRSLTIPVYVAVVGLVKTFLLKRLKIRRFKVTMAMTYILPLAAPWNVCRSATSRPDVQAACF